MRKVMAAASGDGIRIDADEEDAQPVAEDVSRRAGGVRGQSFPIQG